MTQFVIFELVGTGERRAINPHYVLNVSEEKPPDDPDLTRRPTCLIRTVNNGYGGIEARRVVGTLEEVISQLQGQ